MSTERLNQMEMIDAAELAALRAKAAVAEKLNAALKRLVAAEYATTVKFEREETIELENSLRVSNEALEAYRVLSPENEPPAPKRGEGVQHG